MSKEHEISEDKHQARLVSWCRQNKIFIFAIANQQPMAACCSESMVKRILKRLFRIGLEEGMPDLMMPIAKNGKHGLFIEMKKKSGKLATRQTVLASWLNSGNYVSVECKSLEEGKAEILKYLNIEEGSLRS